MDDRYRFCAPGLQVDFVVAAYNAEMQGTAFKVAGLIRAGGCTVDVLLEPKKKVAGTFEYADKMGADKIVFVAPDEWEKGLVAIKDLRSQDKEHKQVEVPVDRLKDVQVFLASA